MLYKILICLRYYIITKVLHMFGSLFIFSVIWKNIFLFVWCFACTLWAGQCGSDTITAYFMMTLDTLGVQWWCSKMTLSLFLGGHHEILLTFQVTHSLLLQFSGVLLLLLLMNNPKALWLIWETGSWGGKLRGVLFSHEISIMFWGRKIWMG